MVIRAYRSVHQSGAPRGTCRYCGNSYLLTTTGHIRKHYVTGQPNGYPEAGARTVCEGSGRIPARKQSRGV